MTVLLLFSCVNNIWPSLHNVDITSTSALLGFAMDLMQPPCPLSVCHLHILAPLALGQLLPAYHPQLVSIVSVLPCVTICVRICP
jgi:hypothetical protein